MELSFDSFRNEFDVTLKGAVSHRVAFGTDARGNITRLDNALAGIPERLERANETGSIYRADIEDFQKRLEEIRTDMREVLVRLSSIQ